MVDVHVFIIDPERLETIALRGEVLSGGRDAGIYDEHRETVAFRPPSPGIFAGQAYANPQARRHLTSARHERLARVFR
jgi:hypothetical protein